MNKKIVSILALGLILIIVGGCRKNQGEISLDAKNEKNVGVKGVEEKINITLKEMIQDLFVEKYGLVRDSVGLEFTQEADGYIKGNISIGKNDTGSIFLAVRTDKKWELVFDGNGAYRCSLAEKYDFPLEMTEDCFGPREGDEVNECFGINFEEDVIEEEEQELYVTEINTEEGKAKTFKGVINKAIKEGPNFSKHFRVVEWFCGEECQDHLIVDLRDGQIVQFGLPSTYGIDYRKTSNLIVVNPPENMPNDIISVGQTKTEYYEFDMEASSTLSLLCATSYIQK